METLGNLNQTDENETQNNHIAAQVKSPISINLPLIRKAAMKKRQQIRTKQQQQQQQQSIPPAHSQQQKKQPVQQQQGQHSQQISPQQPEETSQAEGIGSEGNTDLQVRVSIVILV